jgi:hypothetical protein
MNKMAKLFCLLLILCNLILFMLLVNNFIILGDLSDPNGTHRTCLEIIKRVFDN